MRHVLVLLEFPIDRSIFLSTTWRGREIEHLINNASAMVWENEAFGLSVEGGQPEPDFDTYTFRAPRPGFFVGDSRAPDGTPNQVTLFRLDDPNDPPIPECPGQKPFLGTLDAFPDEILIRILELADPCGVVAFRSVNERARDLVDSVHAFQVVASFPKLLGAATQLRCRSYSIHDLAESVTRTDCEKCGHFGDFLYLIVPHRICYYCFRSAAQRVLEPSIDRQGSPDEIWDVPHASIVPGFYGLTNLRVPRPVLAFDRTAIRRQRPSPFPSRTSNPSNDPIDDGTDPRDTRYLATIRAPYFDAVSKQFEEGFLCRACAEQGTEWTGIAYTRHRPPDRPKWAEPWRRYTRDGMRRHLETHGEVWYLSDGSRLAHSGRLVLDRQPSDDGTNERRHCQVPCCVELIRIGDVLRRCKDKIIELPQLQPYQPRWFAVQGGEIRSTCRRHGAPGYSCLCTMDWPLRS